MKETVLEFGPGRRLIGVLTQPDRDTPPMDVAVVITNAGIIHRVGANRLHVRLARFLAAEGYAVLRYDLPGIGDSETLGTGRVKEENFTATRAAFDTLQARGIAQRFVMVGLCSGADHSFQVTCMDPRVVGAVLIDPTVMFSTRRHRVNMALRTARRGLAPRVWWRLVRGHYQITRNMRRAPGAASAPRPGFPTSISRSDNTEAWSQAQAAFGSLVTRGVHLYLVTTDHSSHVYSYRRQMVDAFPELKGLDAILHVERRPRAGHTFDAEVDRRFLEVGIREWLRSVGAEPAAAEPPPVPVHTDAD